MCDNNCLDIIFVPYTHLRQTVRVDQQHPCGDRLVGSLVLSCPQCVRVLKEVVEMGFTQQTVLEVYTEQQRDRGTVHL